MSDLSNLNVCGIIAEYNPFHKGHAYHIRKSRNRAQADAIIAIISSNFVQRGLPALIDKRARAEMSLLNGVDLALELPVVYSCHNARLFAGAAVDILAATGVVKKICFGMETPCELVRQAAEILAREPDTYKISLRKFLDMGHSFVQSQSMALDETLPGGLELLKKPNNNLAVAYVKRIIEKNYDLEPIAIERIGAGYHDVEASGGIASATAIRELILNGKLDEAVKFMPDNCVEILKKNFDEGHVAGDMDLLWRTMKILIARGGNAELARIAEMREGLENAMAHSAAHAESFGSFVDSCTSRRYTQGRIQRHCTHMLLGLDHDTSRSFQKSGPAYIRVLGANETGKKILRAMRKTATLPVLSRASAGSETYAARMMHFEHIATEIWEQFTKKPRPAAEARYIPIFV